MRPEPVEEAILRFDKLSAHASNIDKATFRRTREPAQQFWPERAWP
jgi:hypothetical protein